MSNQNNIKLLSADQNELKPGFYSIQYSHRMGRNFYFNTPVGGKVRIKATEPDRLIELSRFKRGQIMEIEVK